MTSLPQSISLRLFSHEFPTMILNLLFLALIYRLFKPAASRRHDFDIETLLASLDHSNPDYSQSRFPGWTSNRRLFVVSRAAIFNSGTGASISFIPTYRADYHRLKPINIQFDGNFGLPRPPVDALSAYLCCDCTNMV